MIYTFIAYAPRRKHKNLGWTYNRFMSLLPKEDDWACFIDHDAEFTTREWHLQLSAIVSKHPNAGCFTAMTNRIGNPMQVHGFNHEKIVDGPNRFRSIIEELNRNHNCHDIRVHREIGAQLMRTRTTDVEEMDLHNLMSGVVMLVKKRVWRRIGFADGFLGVDRKFHRECVKQGLKVFLMRGVYVYHWYRGDGDFSHVADFFEKTSPL